MNELFCFGYGYSAGALARRLRSQGWAIGATVTSADRAVALAEQGIKSFVFASDSAEPDLALAFTEVTHVLVSIPPDANGDPVLRRYVGLLATAPKLEWIGYLSTIGIYGDRNGEWVDEETAPQPQSERSKRRLEAERAWLALAETTGQRIQVFRLAGIYGPGRSAIENLEAGTARRIVKPGQVFNRIHVDDIATVLEAAIAHRGTHEIYNVTDDEPAPPQDVVAYGARLVGREAPPEIAFERAGLSPMAQSFYAENKRVRNDRIKADLGVVLAYPTYREGLAAISGKLR